MEEGRGVRRIIGVRRSLGWIEGSFIKTAQVWCARTAAWLLPPRTPTPMGQSSISTRDSVTTKGWRAKSSSSFQSQIRQKTPLLEKHWWGGSTEFLFSLKIKANCSSFLTGKLSCYYLLISLSYCILRCCRFCDWVQWDVPATVYQTGDCQITSLNPLKGLFSSPVCSKSDFLCIWTAHTWQAYYILLLLYFGRVASGCTAWKCIESSTVYEIFTV